MTMKLSFDEVRKKHVPTLTQYVPIVARVHGGSHPEFHVVHKLFNTIKDKLETTGLTRPQLTEEFAQLRAVTNDYRVPDDVCESYSTVYNMLAELDRAYHG
ncbi:MAG: iron-sulfur cluster repair di-iron protein, ric [Firmicutes bacterium]|nr:iron-sulfur cluster repair di-iron protein, ric [Bacillota bacterium]